MADPADQVAHYASKFGWKIGSATCVVEGGLDVAYWELANERYIASQKFTLLSAKFAVTSCGQGDAGGTRGMLERFPFIHRIAAFDAEAGRTPYRFVALFDNDDPGRSAYNVMRNANRNLIEYQDIFLLQRRYPPPQSDPLALKGQIEASNAAWQGFNCEIEDLVDATLLQQYIAANPLGLMKPPQQRNGEWRFDFKRDFKPQLLQYVQACGTLPTLARIVDTIKAFRSYCGLPSGGEPVN